MADLQNISQSTSVAHGQPNRVCGAKREHIQASHILAATVVSLTSPGNILISFGVSTII